jgi:hypothetical protein
MQDSPDVSHRQAGLFHRHCGVTSAFGTELGGGLGFFAEPVRLFHLEGDRGVQDGSDGYRDRLLRQAGDEADGFPLVFLGLVEAGDLRDCSRVLVALDHPPATVLARCGRELVCQRRHHPFPSAGCSCLYSASAVPSETSLWRPIVVRTAPTVTPVWFVSS